MQSYLIDAFFSLFLFFLFRTTFVANYEIVLLNELALNKLNNIFPFYLFVNF